MEKGGGFVKVGEGNIVGREGIILSGLSVL